MIEIYVNIYIFNHIYLTSKWIKNVVVGYTLCVTEFLMMMITPNSRARKGGEVKGEYGGICREEG